MHIPRQAATEVPPGPPTAVVPVTVGPTPTGQSTPDSSHSSLNSVAIVIPIVVAVIVLIAALYLVSYFTTTCSYFTVMSSKLTAVLQAQASRPLDLQAPPSHRNAGKINANSRLLDRYLSLSAVDRGRA